MVNSFCPFLFLRLFVLFLDDTDQKDFFHEGSCLEGFYPIGLFISIRRGIISMVDFHTKYYLQCILSTFILP